MRILPQNLVLLGRRGLNRFRQPTTFLRVLAVIAGVMASASCAKFPVGGGGGQNTHLIFTMRVAGHIQDGSQTGEAPFIYIVAVNPSVDLFPTVHGPEPVVAPPWGNGFVSGNATHFIRYGLDQSSPYMVYQFLTPDLISYGVTGVPVSTSGPGPNGSTIQFEIDLSQITPTGLLPSQLQSVQVNFLTMDKAPTGGYTGPKFWDALGDGHDPNSVNDYIRIPLTSSQIYNNQSFSNLEPAGDAISNLDIVDFSVEVRRP